jgi:hypothetical protein
MRWIVCQSALSCKKSGLGSGLYVWYDREVSRGTALYRQIGFVQREANVYRYTFER